MGEAVPDDFERTGDSRWWGNDGGAEPSVGEATGAAIPAESVEEDTRCFFGVGCSRNGETARSCLWWVEVGTDGVGVEAGGEEEVVGD